MAETVTAPSPLTLELSPLEELLSIDLAAMQPPRPWNRSCAMVPMVSE